MTISELKQQALTGPVELGMRGLTAIDGVNAVIDACREAGIECDSISLSPTTWEQFSKAFQPTPSASIAISGGPLLVSRDAGLWPSQGVVRGRLGQKTANITFSV